MHAISQLLDTAAIQTRQLIYARDKIAHTVYALHTRLLQGKPQTVGVTHRQNIPTPIIYGAPIYCERIVYHYTSYNEVLDKVNL